MINVNVWKHGKAPSKGAYFGPLISCLYRENVGHIDMQFSVFDPALVDYALEHFIKIPHLKVSTYIPKKSQNEQLETKENYLKSDYERGPKQDGIEFIHSYWPSKTPTVKQELKGIFIKGIGVPPEFRTMASDKASESEMISLESPEGEVKTSLPFIQHPTFAANQEKHKTLQEAWSQLNNEVNELKLRLNQMTSQLSQLNNEREKLNASLREAKAQLVSYLQEEQLFHCQQKLDKESRKKLGDELNNVLDDFDQIEFSSRCDLINQCEETIVELKELLHQKTVEIIMHKMDINACADLLLETQKELSVLTKEVVDLEIEREEMCLSLGKTPDHTFSLPTSESGLPFYLNEEAILQEMMRQREEKYSLFGFNCSLSIKKCLLEGIKDIKPLLISEVGVPEEFFKIGIKPHLSIFRFEVETPLSVFQWGVKLGSYLQSLNYKHLAKNEDSKQSSSLADESRLLQLAV